MVKLVLCLIMCDRRRSLRDIARKIGTSFGAVQSTLIDILGMSKVPAGCVRRMLTKDQKKSRLDISKYLLFLYEDDPEEFMRRVVTHNDASVHHYDPEVKKHPGPPLLRNLREFFFSARKAITSIF